MIDSAAAESVHSHTESRIQFLTDTLFERLLREIPRDHSLRNRVTRTEMAFHVGTQPTIAESLLAGEVNKAVARDGLPDTMKTSEVLLHSYRTGLRPYLPHLIGVTSPTDEVTDEMSPAECVFLMLYVSGDLLSRYRGKESSLATRPEPTFAPGEKAKLMFYSWDDSYRRAFGREVSRDDSQTSRALHRFLDGLGFQPDTLQATGYQLPAS